MQATKIRLTKKGGEIVFLEDAEGGKKEIRFTSKETPPAALLDAVKAFDSYVLDLCDLPASWREGLVITTLSIREPDDDGLRGLTVHFHRGLDKANGRVVLCQTPFLPECGDATSDNIRTLDDATMALIEAAEEAAESYVDGARGEQIDAFDEADELEEEVATD